MPTDRRSGFDVLGTQRQMRDDSNLSTAEFAVLVAASLRADKRTGRVRMSIAGVAEDAKVSRRTAGAILQRPHVVRYFANVAGRTRGKDFWFRLGSPPIGEAASQMGTPSDGPIRETGASISATDDTYLGSSFPPSTTPSTSSSTRESSPGTVKDGRERWNAEVSTEPRCGEAAPDGHRCALVGGHDGVHSSA